MSRSRKKHLIVKDKGIKSHYWKSIRRNWKQHLHTNWDDPDIQFESPKTMINDWDYCDWIYKIHLHPQRNNPFYMNSHSFFSAEYMTTEDNINKYYRK